MKRCEMSCKRNCAKGFDIDTLGEYRIDFWEDVPTASERRAKVVDALTLARHQYLRKASLVAVNPEEYPDQLLFKANDKEVCEKFYANLLGMADDKGFKNKRWNDEVDVFVGRREPKQHTIKTNGMASASKREHAHAYILKTVESQIMDKSAHANYDNHLYLPYNTLTVFFDEYVYLCRHNNVMDQAQRSTFALAMKDVIKAKKRDGVAIRLSGGKGNFMLALTYPSSVLSCTADVSCSCITVNRII